VRWIIKVESEVVDLSHVRFSVEGTKVVVVEFRLKKAVSPAEARDIAELINAYITEFVKPENDELVALSGRGPIWLYMLTQHALHGAVANLGAFDPKAGIVVVAVHGWDTKLKAGQLIPIAKIPDEVRTRLSQA